MILLASQQQCLGGDQYQVFTKIVIQPNIGLSILCFDKCVLFKKNPLSRLCY